jgi:predicted ATP-binding protein involved in virulence
MGASTWRPFAPSRWVDELDGEIVTTAELRQRYGLRVKVELGELPEELVAFTQSVPVHRIDTQRLISANELPPHQIPPHRGRVQFEEVDEEAPTVLRYASDLKRRLSDALARNSRTTQALDRTFPARLLASDQSSLTELEIRDRYNTQSQRRELLTRISLIENDAELPLPARTLLAWERIVLTKYLDDTEEKLSTFDDIVERVTLLEEILNRRLLRKSIRVSVEEGIAITTPDHRSIALTDLSSGEQHELILAYDLLFRAETGSLVLIDEPEISLHVAWQRAFMNDMLRICQVSGVRVIIATHSPQIIGKWWDRTQRLGPEFDQPGWSEE